MCIHNSDKKLERGNDNSYNHELCIQSAIPFRIFLHRVYDIKYKCKDIRTLEICCQNSFNPNLLKAFSNNFEGLTIRIRDRLNNLLTA